MSEGNQSYVIFNLTVFYSCPLSTKNLKKLQMSSESSLLHMAARLKSRKACYEHCIFVLSLCLEGGSVRIIHFWLLTGFAMGSVGWSSERGIRVRLLDIPPPRDSLLTLPDSSNCSPSSLRPWAW